ncbi:MAG: hypothetical protein KIT14_12905 [bacterium]|nr:hypothetical protein [bacterium]
MTGADAAGGAPAARPPAQVWLLAIRPRTLPAAVVPVVVGTALAARAGGADPLLAVACLATALLLQIGINLVNDRSDAAAAPI